MGKILKSYLTGVLAILVFALIPAAAQAPNVVEVSTRIEVRAQLIEAFDSRETSQTRFGELKFRGGLVLTSPYRNFGGISSIRVSPDGGSFIALTDKGNWLRGRIAYRGGQPVGITDAEMAPMLGPDGRPLSRRGWYDTESLAEDGGTLYVGIERVQQIVRFDYAKDGLAARGVPIAVPAGVRSLPANKGLECLVVPPKGQPLAGTLIAISERGLDAQGNNFGFLIGGASPGTFTVKRSDDFDITDCATTPRGDLLILERRFSWAIGVAMRIRRLALSQVKPGALLDGPALIFADMGFQIDNMEGLAVHRAATGELVLTLISDDNFSPIQRNLLLQFTLVGE
jgi:hypothetical protein